MDGRGAALGARSPPAVQGGGELLKGAIHTGVCLLVGRWNQSNTIIAHGSARNRPVSRLERAVEAVAEVSEPWHDVALGVQPAVESGSDDVELRGAVLQERGALRRCDDAEEDDAAGAGSDELLHRPGGRAARREHGI